MKKYLIDTNIAIFYMKGKFDLDAKFDAVATENRFISDMPEKKPDFVKQGPLLMTLTF